MDLIISLGPYLVGAVVVVALLNILRTFLRDENTLPDFDSPAADIAEEDGDPTLRQYNLFLAELETLPEAFAQFIDLDRPSPITIPARVSIVGDLKVRFAGHLIAVSIGQHTEKRFTSRYAEAGKFILDILTDRYVFHIYADRVDLYERDDFIGPDDLDQNFFVWSGRLLDQMLRQG